MSYSAVLVPPAAGATARRGRGAREGRPRRKSMTVAEARPALESAVVVAAGPAEKIDLCVIAGAACGHPTPEPMRRRNGGATVERSRSDPPDQWRRGPSRLRVDQAMRHRRIDCLVTCSRRHGRRGAHHSAPPPAGPSSAICNAPAAGCTSFSGERRKEEISARAWGGRRPQDEAGRARGLARADPRPPRPGDVPGGSLLSSRPAGEGPPGDRR